MLVEQQRFPRDKVCGECVSALGAAALARLDLLQQLLSAGAVWLGRTVLHGRAGQTIAMPLPHPMLGVSRHLLDAILLEAAREAGATIMQPVRCLSVVPDEDGALLQIRRLPENHIQALRCDYALIADGKSALLGGAPSPTGDIGIKTHWAHMDGPRDAIELFGCDGCYGGVAAIENGRWNTALSVPGALVRESRGDLDGLFGRIVQSNASLARRLAGATRVIPWLAAPLPRFPVRRQWPARVIPLGNAAAALEPIGGEGMGLALASAELAVRALIDHREAPAKIRAQLSSRYQRLWRVRRLACRTAAMVVSHDMTLDAALVALNQNQRLAGAALAAMGK